MVLLFVFGEWIRNKGISETGDFVGPGHEGCVLRSLQRPLLCHVIVESLLFFLTSHDPWPMFYIAGNVILTLVTTVIYGHTDHGGVGVMQPDAVTDACLTNWCSVMVPARLALEFGWLRFSFESHSNLTSCTGSLQTVGHLGRRKDCGWGMDSPLRRRASWVGIVICLFFNLNF